jgi:hypothetical protein
MFVHVLGPNGEIIRQADASLGQGTHPSNTWRVGEIVFEVVHLPSDAVGTTSYQVRFGLYDLATGRRAEIENADDADIGDSVMIPMARQIEF